MEDTNERVLLTPEQAVAMLPDKEMIHTFRNPVGILVGADWSRADVLEAFGKYQPELSGEMATEMKHGIVFFDEHGALFIETK